MIRLDQLGAPTRPKLGAPATSRSYVASDALNTCRTTARTSLPGVFSAERLADGPHRRDPRPHSAARKLSAVWATSRVRRAVGKSALFNRENA